tara:strand:- start:211 stop:540 length:330 start_codon:yes stop_codon:yes gene_type:complete
MGLIFDTLSYAFVFVIFMITVYLYFAIPVFLCKWFDIWFNRISNPNEEKYVWAKLLVRDEGLVLVEENKPEEIKEIERKNSKWDWKEYRRHSHDTSFVDASMWLSMGDD